MLDRSNLLIHVLRPRNDRTVDALKWTASFAQIIGYTATGMGWLSLNIGFFLVGLFGWLAVGIFWRDKALILVHLVALVAMIGGVLTR